jgi:ABC-type Fe3+ transport system substrate-binding protein
MSFIARLVRQGAGADDHGRSLRLHGTGVLLSSLCAETLMETLALWAINAGERPGDHGAPRALGKVTNGSSMRRQSASRVRQCRLAMVAIGRLIGSVKINLSGISKGTLVMFAKPLAISAVLILAANNALADPRSLDALVAEAQKEGGLRAHIIDTARPEASKIADAFSKRFGLSNVTIGIENESTAFQKARTAIKAGSAPDFDVLVGEDGNFFSFIKEGLLRKVDEWQEVLAAVNPAVSSNVVSPDRVGPGPFSGYAFLFATRDEALIYNTRLINASDLPQTHLDFANPKYKGKFTLPPWSTNFTPVILVYPKDSWLQSVDAIGKNAGAVLYPQEGLNRMLQGDFAFSLMHYFYYSTAKAKDPNVPLAATFLKDAVFSFRVLYGVPTRSKHPASATLFALWMTSDGSRELMQPSLYQANVETGQTKLDEAVRAALKASGAKVVSWFADSKSQAEFEWVTTTDDGKKYNQAIGQALTQRK